MTDIFIAGLGLQTATHLSRGAADAMRASNEVLYLDTGVATRAVLEELCPRVTPLYDLTYCEEGSRAAGYEHVAARVVEAALDHPPVTFALHGHPLIAALPPFLVLEMARALDLRAAVLPGISAIDTIFADLGIDPIVGGMQMYEATDLLLRRRPLQPDVPALVWQIGSVETCLHTMRVSRPERFARVVDHLRLFYPARHEVTAIFCSPHPLLPAEILRFPLQEMGEHARELHAGYTLYIPAAAARPVQDTELLARLYSVEHLRAIT